MKIRSTACAWVLCLASIAGAAHAQTPPASTPPPPPAEPPPAPGAVPAPGTTTAPYYQAAPPTEQAPVTPVPPPTPQMNSAIYVEQPPLPPLEPRNRHYHDGFYLRMSAGFDGMWTHSGTNSGSATTSGVGPSFDLMVGGTPSPGLVIGGGLLLHSSLSPSTGIEDKAIDLRLDAGASSSLWFLMVGPMIDMFPNPTGGFHFGGMLGFTTLNLKDHSDNWSNGLGLSAWTGYMWWNSSQWSTGGLLRFTAASSARKVGEPNELDVNDTTWSLAALLSVVYH